MEEWVGGLWHKLLMSKTTTTFDSATVRFADEQKSIRLMINALSGRSRHIQYSPIESFHVKRSLLAKVAGRRYQTSLAWQDDHSVYLPEAIAIFPDVELNRFLYRWLALLVAEHSGRFQHWAHDNQALVQAVLSRYPVIKPKYQAMAEAYVKLRQQQLKSLNLSPNEQLLEQCICQAILTPEQKQHYPVVNIAPYPVLLWLYPAKPSINALAIDAAFEPEGSDDADEATQPHTIKQRKKAQRLAAETDRDGLMLFRLENLFSWSEFTPVDRSQDDSENDDAGTAAQDLDEITLSSKQTQRMASAIKIDLDLPSASEDDIPLGPGIQLPEWDYRQQQLIPDRCLLQPLLPRDAQPMGLPSRLKRLAQQLQAQFAQWQSLRFWQKRQYQGEELDLSALVDFKVEQQIQATAETGLFQSFNGYYRDLSCLVLADLSLSTDAHLSADTRVIDVIKDSLLLFSEALSTLDDHFALYGFSSVKRHQVRLTMLKNFNEAYSDIIRGRILATQPGFYTRMGAAIRQATKVLLAQNTTERLLLIITDGKPNDIDHYEGKFGIEDCRHAILAAKQQGLKPFCLTIDQEADEYIPYIFGAQDYVLLAKPEQMPIKLMQIYAQLTQNQR
jgi:nitric oxide reductase NorD protein